MVNTIQKQVIVDGDRNLVVKYNIIGDGSGEEGNNVLVDASTFAVPYTNCKLMRVDYGLNGFAARLKWKGAANAEIVTLVDEHTESIDFHAMNYMGGIPNNATTPNGDILITTIGLGLGDTGHIILYIKKKDD